MTMKAACGLMTCLPAGGTYGGLTSLPLAFVDGQDRRVRDLLAAVGERPVGGHEIDRPDLLHAEGEGQLRLPLALELHPELLGLGVDVVGRVEGHRLDGRDVERELERVADADGAALEAVGVVGRVAAPEVRADVHQHRAGGDGLVVDADRVVERLERRSGLAIAVADDVELRLEVLLARRGVVVRAADVGDQLAGLVVDRHERAVVEVLALEVGHPRLELLEPERLGRRRHVLLVRDDGRGADPLLGDLLEADVEGRGDPQPAEIERVARRRRRRTAWSRARRGPPTRSAGRSSAASPGCRGRPAHPRRR